MLNYRLYLFLVLFTFFSIRVSSEVFFDSDLAVLVRLFESDPSDAGTTRRLLTELSKEGQSGQSFIDRYFATQQETDYCNEQNWALIRDFVHDYNAPQFKYVFNNQAKFLALYSKDVVYQKLDNVLVSHLNRLYRESRMDYENMLQSIRSMGYAHYDVLYDYFNIRNLLASRNAEDYFYKARKLFRYFPENLQMIKEITAGALEIMDDVSRLKVIQLWAGKTVESRSDFEAICNYVKISQKCGFSEVAKKYVQIAEKLAEKEGNELMKKKVGELLQLIK